MRIPVTGKVYTMQDKLAMMECIMSGEEITYGSWNVKFEKMLAEYIGTKHAYFVNSGSSANLLAFMAFTSPEMYPKWRVSPGDEIITVAAGFPTTVAPIVQYGAVPVFVDIDSKTYNVDVTQLDKALSENTKGVMLAHTLGNPFNVRAVMEFCERNNLFLIEDNCLVGSTIVTMDIGEKRLDEIQVNDMVMTRQGAQKVVAVKKSYVNKVISQCGIVGTEEHRVITIDGPKYLKDIQYTDRGYIWNSQKSHLTEMYIADTQTLLEGIFECIIGTGVGKIENLCIDEYGNSIMERLKQDMIYTIKTKILLTILLKIWKYYRRQNTIPCTSTTMLSFWKKFLQVWNWQGKRPKNGIEAQKDSSGTVSIAWKGGLIEKLTLKFVKYVIQSIKHTSPRVPASVPSNAKVGRKLCEETAVYDITVAHAHEFVANGILVHNCDGFGSTYDGKRTGSFGTVSTSSFYPAHHLSTGQGGAVFTDDPLIAKILLSMRNWGKACVCQPNQNNVCGSRFTKQYGQLPEGYDHKYVFSNFGYNLQGTNILASLGCSQMERIEVFTTQRHANFNKLYSLLEEWKERPFKLPVTETDAVPSWFGFPILLDSTIKRNVVMSELQRRGVDSRTLFAGNITRQPCFTDNPAIAFGVVGTLDETDKVMDRTLWLGCWHGLYSVNMEEIASTLKEVLNDPIVDRWPGIHWAKHPDIISITQPFDIGPNP